MANPRPRPRRPPDRRQTRPRSYFIPDWLTEQWRREFPHSPLWKMVAPGASEAFVPPAPPRYRGPLWDDTPPYRLPPIERWADIIPLDPYRRGRGGVPQILPPGRLRDPDRPWYQGPPLMRGRA